MDPSFVRSICLELSRDPTELSKIFCIQEELSIASLLQLSSLQEPSLFVARRRAFILSGLLLDSSGRIDSASLSYWISFFEKGHVLFSPDRSILLEEHFFAALKHFLDPEFLALFHRFSLPLAHSSAENLIRFSLFLNQREPLTDGLVRRAVLSALLTPLRQNIGACFATAPAILIQKDQAKLLLQDLYDLLTTSRLTRTFSGIAYSIPMSFSTGASDLRKNVLSSPSWLSPSLFQILSPFAGLSSPELLQTFVQQLGKGKKTVSVEELIEEVLLTHFSLTKETVKQAENLEKAQVQHFQRGLVSFAPSHAKSVAKVNEFTQAKEWSLERFKAFCDHPLLKIWEFTIASFSEVKMEFSKWNFAISLGFSDKEKGGIGRVIVQELQSQLHEINKKITIYHEEYIVAFEQTRATETLLRNAGSEQEGRRLRAEHQSRSYHMRMALEMRDSWKEKGENISKLAPFLIEQYDKRFPEYFQELYDPNMQEVQEGMYQDSPAGFRLVYKHGREDPHLWTLIHKEEQYLQSLSEFFNLTESAIAALCEWEGGRDVVRDVTAKILLHLYEESFLQTAIQRMAKAHTKDGSEKKPWCYTSGGTMTTLVKTYYGRESDLTFEEKKVENPTDLLVFILDSLKNLPPRVTEPYVQGKKTGMLMNSPSHAYILLPEKSKLGWQGNEFSYTWVRDEMIKPSLQFYEQMVISEEEQEFLFHKMGRISPLHGIHLSGAASPKELRSKMVESLQRKEESYLVDAFLFESLPVISREMAQIRLIRFLTRLDKSLDFSLLQLPSLDPFITAREFYELVKGCYLSLHKNMVLSFDLYEKIALVAREEGLSPPSLCLIADTNWPENFFAFVINPGTSNFELWRVYDAALRGFPMNEWKQWFNGKKEGRWTIYTNPKEYTDRG